MTTNHYPITKGSWILDNNDIMFYLTLFEKHELTCSKISKLSFLADHIYPSGLHIKTTWKILKQPYFNLNQLTMDSLFELQIDSYIELQTIKIHSYSSQEDEVSEDTKEAFLHIIHSKLGNIHYTKEQYNALEFNVNKPTKLENSHFEDLMLMANNYTLFEDYLLKNGK